MSSSSVTSCQDAWAPSSLNKQTWSLTVCSDICSHLPIQQQFNSLCERAKFGFHWEYTWSLNSSAPRFHSCHLFLKSWHNHKSPEETIPSSSSLPISSVMNGHVSFQQAGQLERGREAVCFLLSTNQYQQPLGFYQRRISSATSQCRLGYIHLCLYNMMYILGLPTDRRPNHLSIRKKLRVFISHRENNPRTPFRSCLLGPTYQGEWYNSDLLSRNMEVHKSC